MWSAGACYTFESGLMLKTAYGESKKHLWSGHFKVHYDTVLDEERGRKIRVGYQLYMVGDNDNSSETPNDNFDGTACQHVGFFHFGTGLWLFRLEGTYTLSPFDSEHQMGNFVYRLTDRNGSSKGVYDIWWGARSDWNHHNEKAAFIGVDRNLDDFLPLNKGFSVGAGAAMGWGGEAYGTAQHLKEWAFNFDIDYTHPEGPLEGASIKLHFTEYCNGTNLPSWGRIKTAFSPSVISSLRGHPLFAVTEKSRLDEAT